MILESLLAFLHISAILAVVVFITSETALCRPEWMNATIVERLVKVDRIYLVATAAVLVTGLLRIFLGIKGGGWYLANWLLHLKFAMFVVVALMSLAPTRSFAGWRKALRDTGALPDAQEVRRVRKRVMAAAHIIPFIPLAAVFLARGFGGHG